MDGNRTSAAVVLAYALGKQKPVPTVLMQLHLVTLLLLCRWRLQRIKQTKSHQQGVIVALMHATTAPLTSAVMQPAAMLAKVHQNCSLSASNSTSDCICAGFVISCNLPVSEDDWWLSSAHEWCHVCQLCLVKLQDSFIMIHA